MTLLNPGDQFPPLTIDTTDGQELTLPGAFAGDFGVVLFYRGSWCPYCNAQLRSFERAGQTLADAGIRVAALSVDDKDTTTALVAKHKLAFPVGYGADAHGVAALTGAFVTPDPVYLQSTGFVLDPRARSWSACTQAARSGGWYPRTSLAWSGTCASTPLPRRPSKTVHPDGTRSLPALDACHVIHRHLGEFCAPGSARARSHRAQARRRGKGAAQARGTCTRRHTR